MICLLAMVILSSVALGLVFEVTGKDRRAVFSTVLFRQVFVTDTVMIAFVLALTYLAATVNYTFNLHRYCPSNMLRYSDDFIFHFSRRS